MYRLSSPTGKRGSPGALHALQATVGQATPALADSPVRFLRRGWSAQPGLATLAFLLGPGLDFGIGGAKIGGRRIVRLVWIVGSRPRLIWHGVCHILTA